MIRRYGILNTTIVPDHGWYGIPFPGTFVLDAQGRVKERHFEESYRTRMTGSTLALQVGSEPGPPPNSAFAGGGNLLEVSIYSSDPTVAPGQEFTVVIDVRAKPGVHVYAPGSHPYGAVRFELEPDSLFAERDAIYPEPRDYHFEPLDEHVPVFEGSFRILKPVVIKASRGLGARAREPGAAVTLSGTLKYQACDDKICYMPESVPVQLTLGLRPLEP